MNEYLNLLISLQDQDRVIVIVQVSLFHKTIIGPLEDG